MNMEIVSATSCSCGINKVMEGKNSCDQNSMNCISSCQEKSDIKRPSITFEWPVTTRVLSQQALQKTQLRMPLQVYDFALFSNNKIHYRTERKHSKEMSFLDFLSITSFCKRIIGLTVLSSSCGKIIGRHLIETFLAICFQDVKVGTKL
jgi:hypothetical protein